MDGWMHGWMNGWMDGWMDEWMDRWMDGWMENLQTLSDHGDRYRISFLQVLRYGGYVQVKMISVKIGRD